MSIGGTVGRFAKQSVTVKRYEGFYSSGRWKKREVEAFVIKAGVQPASPADLQRMPENYRKQGAFRIFPKTSVTLRTGSASTSQDDPGVMADEVVIKGVVYEVAAVMDWPRHASYLAARHQQ